MRKLLSLLAISLFLLCSNAWADTHTWQGDDLTNPTYWNDADNWDVAAVPAAGDDVIIANANNCFINANTAALKSLDMTGYTGTLSGTYNITIRGLTASTNVCKIVGIGTWTGTLIFSPASTTAVIQLTSNANALTKMTITSGAAVSLVVLQDNLTFTAAKTNSITLSERGLDLNGKTITGNSAVNKLLITSVTLGTSTNITITGATATSFNNVDFRDISFATAGALDLTNGQVNWIGDCGGNSATGGALTFTTADDWYWNGSGTRNFSDYTYWYTATNGGGSQMGSTRVPLPQDNCYFDANSIDAATIVKQDMSRVCKTLDFTGVGVMEFQIYNVVQTIYGSLLTNDNVNLTQGAIAIIFEGRNSFILSMGDILANCFGGDINISMVGGKLTLLSNYLNLGYILNLNNGTFDANDYDVCPNTISTGANTFNSSNSNARTLLMGNGTWNIRSGQWHETPWNMATITNLTNPTTMGEGSTINWTFDEINFDGTFAGGGCSYNNLNVNSGANDDAIITNSNTFNTFTINAPKTVKFTAGTTTTVSSFVATGTAVNGITITSVTSAAHTLTDTAGTNAVEYCTISYSQAGGGATWNAYTTLGNTDGGNNTGWVFTAPSGRREMFIQ